MMFGHYEIVLKTSKGTGIVSSLVLQSDDLDEVDWEWLGADNANVQTNYYGKGNTAVYDRGETIPNAGNQDSFMTYSLDWTADAIVWAVNGKTIRTLTPQTADANQYPQSPMQLKIGTWSAGDPGEPAGTVTWAGGATDYSKAPFTMTIKSVKAVDYSTGKSYSYGDQTGSWGSIKSDGGQINGKGNADASASTVAAAGSSITQVSGTAANTAVPVSGSARPATVTTGISASATGAAGKVSTMFTSSTAALHSSAPAPTSHSSSSSSARPSASCTTSFVSKPPSPTYTSAVAKTRTTSTSTITVVKPSSPSSAFLPYASTSASTGTAHSSTSTSSSTAAPAPPPAYSNSTIGTHVATGTFAAYVTSAAPIPTSTGTTPPPSPLHSITTAFPTTSSSSSTVGTYMTLSSSAPFSLPLALTSTLIATETTTFTSHMTTFLTISPYQNATITTGSLSGTSAPFSNVRFLCP